MASSVKTHLHHRQPVGFGPAAGPRQDLRTGERFTAWRDAYCEITDLVLDVERASAQKLLPAGYFLAADAEPTVLFGAMNLRNLPWLNGRGYNTLGIYLNDVVYQSKTEGEVHGSYLLVLFENMSDPIVTGREELGFPKVWAEIPDPVKNGDATTQTLSWFGHEFLRLDLPNLGPAKHGAPSQKPFGHPGRSGILTHRYIPTVGRPGEHDASYAVYMPGSSQAPQISERAVPADLDACKVFFGPSTWEDLPTIHTIVDGLKSMQLGRVRDAVTMRVQGASDCSGARKVD